MTKLLKLHNRLSYLSRNYSKFSTIGKLNVSKEMRVLREKIAVIKQAAADLKRNKQLAQPKHKNNPNRFVEPRLNEIYINKNTRNLFRICNSGAVDYVKLQRINNPHSRSVSPTFILTRRIFRRCYIFSH